MSRFNESSVGVLETVNHENAKAYKISPENELYTLACTCLLNNKFYEKAGDQKKRLLGLLHKVDPKFVAQLAIYVREKMYLRSLPVILAVELAKIHKGDSLVSKTVNRIVQRADELTEILAYYQKTNKRKETKKLNKLSKQLQKGLASAFNKFDEYQFAKYNRDTEVALKDALFVVHPKPKDSDQEIIFNKIVEDQLEVPYTWEVELSRLGQKKYETTEEKEKVIKEKWQELIESKKLGYMATLRNLRNILNAKVSKKHIDKICNYLSNPVAVKKSRQLPFRFFSAYKIVESNKSLNANKILEALEEASKLSINNIPGLDCDVLIASDTSASMSVTISAKSTIMNYEIALLLGQLLRLKAPSNICGIFADTWKVKRFSSQSPLQNTLAQSSVIGEVGHSTNGYLIVDWLIKNKQKLDKVFIFTDMQLWESSGWCGDFASSWRKYKREVAPNAELYLFDLAGYGTTPISVREDGVYLIAGWSEKVFEAIEALKNGQSALKIIKAIDI